ncbi:hypothetical protein [Nocardioides solisilvae]|uniref:hypothetical protein n=1 Tax=Nocardioides solisilvae TaxID=1542435 RepID=UPI000D74B003|nr:hypothetical protein [Nocardioides solisilvae]
MDEDFHDAAPEAPEPVDAQAAGEPVGAASERVGVPAVDAVLAEVERVGELPVAEQVAVFERAHEQLRRALDASPVPAALRPEEG